MTGLPADAKARKERPIARGVLDYFPDAVSEVAHTSFVGNEQHNPGQPMHWAKEKSTDEADALVRHLVQRGTVDSDGIRHSAKVAWRALALLQREIDQEKAKGRPETGTRKRIYIAGPITKQPYQGPLNAVKAADALLNAGHYPYVPHLSAFWAMATGDKPYEQWLELDFAWIECCDALLRLPGESSGSDREVEHAKRHGIPVFFSLDSILAEYPVTVGR